MFTYEEWGECRLVLFKTKTCLFNSFQLSFSEKKNSNGLNLLTNMSDHI